MNEGNFLPRWVSVGLIPLLNLLLAFLVSGIVIFFIGENPLQAILVMIKGAFYYPGSIGYTLYYTTNFIFAGLAVALALPEDGKIVACDISEEWTSIGRKKWEQAGVADKIDLRIGPAIETLDELIAKGEEASFDFAFIDADKANYLDYYKKCLRLVRKGGVIAIDNVLWSGAVINSEINDNDTNAIKELNDFLAQDDRVSLSMVPIGDGLTLAFLL